MPNTVPHDYNPYAGCHIYEELREEIKQLKEQNESLHIIATEGARKGLEKNKEIAKLKSQIEDLTTERDHLITKIKKRNTSKSRIANRDQGLKL